MVAKVINNGTQPAIPVTEEMMRQMGIDAETPLDITVEAGCLVVKRASSATIDASYRKAADEVFDEREDLLRRLA
ncbi:MAG: hypothetical protein AAF586_06670 [Planctomycetota bacterium]